MKNWDINQRPPLGECPKEYCFCWTPSGGTADLSGQSYDSFKEVIKASKNGVAFLHGGCASPIRPCRRLSKNTQDGDSYEPANRFLRKAGLPELFFCNPDSLYQEDQEEYEKMANEIWIKNA